MQHFKQRCITIAEEYANQSINKGNFILKLKTALLCLTLNLDF